MSFHSCGSSSSSKENTQPTKRRIKLPKIEVRKFSGESLDWISWWSQFSKIHLSDDVPAVDKFEYLIAALTPNTRAYNIVTGYPMSELNYAKAVDALKTRYANPKLLKQLYVRELLKMIIQTQKSGEKFELSKHFDQLESHLRALETLGVSAEQTSKFLYPMVESSLPDNILIAWQRSPHYSSDSNDTEEQKTELTSLMEFLARKAASEIQRKTVREGFTRDGKLKNMKPTMGKGEEELQTPITAAGLLATDNSAQNSVQK